MANSDNVLRAGLTPKYMDVPELAKCTKFAEKPASTLLLEPVEQDHILLFPVPVPDFKFAIFPQPDNVQVSIDSAEVLMPLDSDLTLESNDGTIITISKGQSVFVPAYTGNYKLRSLGRVARAYN
jgi:mannose-6-phosphate isomerase